MLLRAREQVSQAAQRAARALDEVTKAQDRVSDSSKRAGAAVAQQRGALEQIYETRVREKKRLDESTASLREQSAELRRNAAALREQAAQRQASVRVDQQEIAALRESARVYATRATALQRLADARREQSGAETDAVRKLQQAANAQTRLANNELRTARARASSISDIVKSATALDKEAKAADSSANAFDKSAATHERSSSRISRSIETVTQQISNLERSTSSGSAATTRFGRVLQRLGIQSDGTKSSLRGLNAEFQGFQLAIVIKYAQSLLSTLIALGAQLVAVAAAAGQAAAGLAAAFGAAAAQAVPVVGVLAAAFSRLTTVLKAVKLQNQQQLTASHDAQTAARRQTGAADQIRNAQQQVADAHRNVARAVQNLAQTEADASRQQVQAQNDVTQARKDAIRTVQDLIAAERDAQVQLLQAQASLRGSLESGDVLGTLAAFDARAAARRGATRARQDAAPVRARGVEGVPAVQQTEQRLSDVQRTNARQIASAQQQVADAQRQANRSEQDLNRTRREAAQNVAQETASVDKLADSLKQLSPAERDLYKRILALQDTYRRVARPITDIITNAFTGVVDRVNKLLQNPQIIRGFRNIAVEVARSIRQATGEAGGARSVGVFETLQREAAHNLPTVTRIAVNFFRTLRSLVVDALPAFRLLLGYIDGYARNLRRAVETRPGQLTNFFKEGVRYANQFFKLGLAVVRLFLAIGGRGGAAAEGTRTIQDLTGYVDHLTDRVNHNAGSIRRFFASTHDSVKEVLGVLGTLGATLFQAFNPQSIKTLADFLNEVIIPALGTTIQVMGVLVNTFHQFLALPGVAQVAELAATFLLLARGLDIIHHAVSTIIQILPNFLRGFGLMAAEGEAAEGTFLGLGIAMGGWVLIVGGAVIAAIILLNKHFHFLGPTFKWLKGVAAGFFGWFKGAAEDVVNWFKDVWTQGLLYWIRAPFIALAKIIGRSTLFHAIIDDAKAVIDFFTTKQTGGWGVLKDIMLAPFRALRGALKIIFDIIKGVVKVFLDVLAGRFDDAGQAIKDMFNGVLDTLTGAATTFLGVWQTILGALGKIPKIGGPFRDAADAIGGLKDKLDGFRESLRDHKDKQDKSNDSIKEALPNLVKLHDRYEGARDRLSKLTPGTRSYKDAVKDATRKTQDYVGALHDTATKADDARPHVKTLRDNIFQLGGVTHDTAKSIADQLNDVLKQVGARTIRLNTKAYRTSGINRLTDVTGHGATGGVLSRSSGLHQRFWGGGIPNASGGAADDHILYSPMGAPVAALSGTEGIINRPQMHAIDSALGIANALGAMPWGSLNDLWGSGMRHYAAGGKLQLPTNFRSTHQTSGLDGYPAIDVFGSPGTQVGSPIAGRVVKLSGRPPSAGAYRGPGGPFGWSEYISGGGRTYYLTHFGSRSVSLGQRVRYGQTLGTVGDYPGSVPDHIHEGLHGAGMAVTGGAAALPSINAPRITGDTGPLGRLARASARVLARAANAYLARNVATFGAGDSRGIDLGDFRGGTATGNGAGLMRQIARRRGWNFNDWWAIDARETGHGSNLVNPTSTARLRGQFLSMNWGKYGPGSDPRRHPSMAQQIQSMAAYIDQRYGNPSRAWAHERAFGWYRGGGPLRRLQTGGPLKGVARTPTPTARPRNPLIAGSFSASMNQLSSIMATITDALSAVSGRSLRRVHHLATGIAAAFDKLTGDNGVLDLMQSTVESIATFAAVRLQQMQFRITRAGARRTYVSPAALAQDNLQTLQSTRGGLTDERTVLQGSLVVAQRTLNEAQRRGNARAARVARAAVRNLTQRIDKNTADLAQNAQDQVEAQESFQQALVDSVTAAADQQNTAIDRWQRVARAFGRSLDPNVVVGAQIANMQRQIGGLRGVLRRAIRTGNLDLATSVRSQIDELNTQIAEAVAQQFQNSIDAVNNQAQRSLGANDRIARRAQIGGTDFGVLGASLQQRGGILDTQRAGLLGLLAQAQASGNIDQIVSLTDQIDELNTQLLENTQAVRDNTDAGFNARTQQINDAFGFTQTVLSSAQSFFQALTEATGIDTSGQQRASLAGVGAGLATQRQGLTGQLGALIGLSPADLASLQNLNPSDFVNYLVSIASGPAFEAIMARLDPTQQSSFRDLITALIGNVTATQQNTTALTQLTGGNGQGFSSSFWTAFRTAIFTGEGGLLPQYAMTIPGADVGARVLQSGALMVHAGESVRPAAVSRDWREGGDTYNLNLTTPTQVLDPVDVNRQLAFLRKTSGR